MKDDQLAFDLAESGVVVEYVPEPRNWHLLPQGSVTTCPKCAAMTEHLITAYHSALRLSDPCGRMFIADRQGSEFTDFPEHLCRTCRQCNYGWVEGVSDGL
jgi:hypothetical protein